MDCISNMGEIEMTAASNNSGHTVRAELFTQMLGFASHFVCPQAVI